MTRQSIVEQRLPRPDNLTLPGNQSSLLDGTPSDEGVAGLFPEGSSPQGLVCMDYLAPIIPQFIGVLRSVGQWTGRCSRPMEAEPFSMTPVVYDVAHVLDCRYDATYSTCHQLSMSGRAAINLECLS